MIYDKDLTPAQLEEKHKIRFDKIKDYFIDVLKEKGCKNSLIALAEAETYHKGKRKNGAPEFMHQLEICLFLTTLPQLPQDTEELDDFFTAALLHDIREDYHLSHQHIETKYSARAANWVELLTKEFNGVKKPTAEYFNDLAGDPLAALLKLADRFHNISTMHGAFTPKKQREYIQEVKEYFYPLMKKCLKLYPEYNLSFYLLKNNIEVLCHTIQGSLNFIDEIQLKIGAISDKMQAVQEKTEFVSNHLENEQKIKHRSTR